ncbi:MFS transporter [Paenibacillus macquariensis subsp. macquariensis]|uniref:MFS transporter, CP family, cyanate transporter n=2 Tax=Paenibacillus macquariensis TaxID=948756 RepID=A0ABY1JNT1_9BACL|nr:MFS transporter [Paenibacillus macquariensis]OAB37329.1 MFS transporter [Paenibacillus macquariensis subsp. macquariensis]SIQ50938.1 MFS transporter, CP family, cyanate transporter [Paenibacillus macquariensis]
MRFVYLIMIICLVSLNLRPSITSVGPLLDIIQTSLGMSGLTASLITTLPVLCMGLFAIASITLNNRLGIEKSLLLAMSLIFMATLLRMFVHDSTVLLITALISGTGIGIAGPLISGFIKKHFPDRPGLTGIYSVSMVIGAAIASSFSIPLFHMMNDSWQRSLSFWSILAIPAALLLLPLLKKSVPNPNPIAISTLFIKNKRVNLFMIFFACMAAIFYSITAWLAPIVQSTGLSHAQSGNILTLFTVIQIPISLSIPMIVGRTGNRKLWLILCSLSEIIGILLLLLHFSPWLATIFLGIGAGGLFPLAILMPIQEARSTTEAISWSAMVQFGGYLLASLGPAFIGLTVDLFDNFVPALIVLVIIICIMTFTILKIGNTTEHIEKNNA